MKAIPLKYLTIALLLAIVVALGLFFKPNPFDPIDEASGLVASKTHSGVFWTLNDSGGDPMIFAIDGARKLVAKVWVDGATNRDWESITLDGEGHLLIMDSGNNENKRRDLCIYKLKEPTFLLPPEKTMQVTAERIEFHFREQRSFPDESELNFDGEASFYVPGDEENPSHLYLLTKHRSDTNTILYEFPPLIPETTVVPRPLDRFNVGGQEHWFGGRVTGASYSESLRLLAVLTYHRIFVFDLRQRPIRFGDPIATVELDWSITKQVEGIAWSKNDLVIVNEQGQIWHVNEGLWQSESAVFPRAN